MRRARGSAPRRDDRTTGGEPDGAPIIMTLQFDAATAAFFERQRREHFPPALNRTPAHLTLFHALPGERLAAVMAEAGRAARRPPFTVTVDDAIPLGRGVAYRVEAPQLHALRKELAQRFAQWLTGQDRERFRPHVTVQNKVTPQQARRTLERLVAAFEPFTGRAEGLQLWRYRGGPWEPAGAVAFG
jgi:2'-5' RNA ligase